MTSSGIESRHFPNETKLLFRDRSVKRIDANPVSVRFTENIIHEMAIVEFVVGNKFVPYRANYHGNYELSIVIAGRPLQICL